MKKLINTLAIILFTGSIAMAQTGKTYGEPVDEKKAISMQQLNAAMKGKTTMDATVSGKVAVVCKAEGCWMKIDQGNGETMMVRMKDHKFFLPKDIDGKAVVFTGTALVKTTTVDMLKHYAEDEGKSKEYIEAIKADKTELAFEATGVIVK